MKVRKVSVVLAAAIAAAAVIYTPEISAEEEPGETKVLLDRLLFDIRDTLIRVRNETAGALELKHAKLNLTTVLEKGASGKLNLVVVSFGGGTSTGTTQTLSVTLQSPLAGDPLPVSGTSDALADAILQAYKAAQFAATSDPPLRLNELESSVKFVVAVEGSGGAKVSILPVSADMGGKISQSNVHSISLAFCAGPCP